MPSDRRLPGSAADYPDDANLLAAVLREPDDLVTWPATGLAAEGFTPGQQAIAATWRVDTEVRNGGFGLYFAALGPEAAEAARDALDGLERLAAHAHRELLTRALALLERGLPEAPPPFVAPSEADVQGPPSEARYEASLRRILGALGPDLERVRERARARRAWEEALHAVFGALDDGWRALAVDGRSLERAWVAYVRTHPREFFRR
ncbi:MAG TPA: DUF4375 domain-containing protein [Anaeromyxobacteraceae bacterium]|nr:DUF4375 domain-containing protein [Anaeromyxobacteraceae bacterium]